MWNRKVQFKKLCEPITIGNMNIKNRMVMPAMAVRTAANGFVTDRTKFHFGERAKGGVGLIIVGIAAIDYRQARLFDEQLSIDDDRFIPGLSDLVEIIHSHGAKAALQLHHGGNVVSSAVTGLQPVAPSPIARPGHEMPRELTCGEIADIVTRFAEGAIRAQKAGFDAVELNACHRYIIQNFLSSAWNKRKDSYGGDLKNRARFLLEIIGAIKEIVGKDYPLLVRLNGKEYSVKDGTTLEEAMEVSLLIQTAGVDAVHISAFPATYPYPRSVVPPTLPIFHPGCYAHLAAGVKGVVSIPVIAVGRITPEFGERMLRRRKADLIAFGRGLIADPELPNKVIWGRADDIRRCLGCNECYGSDPVKHAKHCTVNAAAFMQDEEPVIRPIQKAKKVLIVGGGPAGMEAARVAAQRGHEVILCEKGKRLGGQLLLATMIRNEYGTLTQYLSTQIRKLGVKIALGKRVTSDYVQEIKPDVIVFATGITSHKPKIPGIDSKNIISAESIIERKILWYLGSTLANKPLGYSLIKWLLKSSLIFGKKVVVMGAGLAGCELADFLMERGKQVSIVTEEESMADGLGTMPVLKGYLLDKLSVSGCTMLSGARYERITKEGLVITTREGQPRTLEADKIICVAGVQKNTELSADFEKKAGATDMIGDCAEPRGIMEAIHDGYRIGNEL